MSLKSQRRLASEILKIGGNRIWIDSDRINDVEAAITREEIRKLIHEGVIRSKPRKGISRSRARVLQKKRRKGLRKGFGKKKGSAKAKASKKLVWMRRIRTQRKKLRDLRAKHLITDSVHRRLYNKAGAGIFESITDLERHIKSKNLERKR